MVFAVMAWEQRPQRLMGNKNLYRGIKVSIVEARPDMAETLRVDLDAKSG